MLDRHRAGQVQDADYAVLKRIAKATGGEADSAETPEDILNVFAQAIASR